jgi:hypothetical protein
MIAEAESLALNTRAVLQRAFILATASCTCPSRRRNYLARFGWTVTIASMSVRPHRQIINPVVG